MTPQVPGIMKFPGRIMRFRKRYGRRIATLSAYALMGILLILTVVLLKKVLFFILLAGLTGITVFLINRVRMPFDLSPAFFGTVMVMHFYGPWHAVLFLVLASAIPSVVAGGIIDFIGILSMLSLLLISSLVFLTGTGLPYALILVAAYAAVAFVITLSLDEPGKALATFAVLLGVNSAYFIALGSPLMVLGDSLT